VEYRRLGASGLKVSAIALGGWINFGASKMENERARSIIVAAYESGINFFDQADIYERGQSEEQWGRVLGQFPRHTLVVSSKVFWPMSSDVNDRGLSRKHIIASIDNTLRRLGTDYLDIYFCHRPDPETPILETARAMDDLIHRGKILYWGTSEWSGDQIAEAHGICERYGLYSPQAEQPQYSMLHRQRVESEILPVTEPRGIGLVVFSPMAQGMLTGKYDDGVPEGTRFDKEEWARDRLLTDAHAAKVRRLKEVADDLGITRGQLALAWVLRQPGVSGAITGATDPEQVRENVRAASVTLASEVIVRIDQILAD
jgi:voltage-dependent potassium channel beta subunit